ncbi:MAG: NADH-quinone oxidoreductase subunit C [Campylobacter sp.]|nr:NADH-quinone oxidoreductase subunit C [Campylobacter sp.]
MREFLNRTNAQKKQYYTNKFYVAPSTPKIDAEGSKFQDELDIFKQNNIEILNSYIEHEQLVISVKAEQNYEALKSLKDYGYEILNEIGASDYTADENCYEVFYQILSISRKKRARLKCKIQKEQMLQSVTALYRCANWAEREMYDMSGVLIANHPNLKRLIMPDDWSGHPLLKSYPLVGDEFAKWYEVDKIFGKERREEIGEENRDPAFVDSKDTFNFSRLGHEVEYGENALEFEKVVEYQEDGGVKFVTPIKKGENKIVKERP